MAVGVTVPKTGEGFKISDSKVANPRPAKSLLQLFIRRKNKLAYLLSVCMRVSISNGKQSLSVAMVTSTDPLRHILVECLKQMSERGSEKPPLAHRRDIDGRDPCGRAN